MEVPKAHNRCGHLNREIFCAPLRCALTAVRSDAHVPEEATMTVDESKALKKGDRVYWQGTVADSGIITETSWDAVTIAWNNGQVARVHHGDMREIGKTPPQPHTV
jgi:hypothetical protein